MAVYVGVVVVPNSESKHALINGSQQPDSPFSQDEWSGVRSVRAWGKDTLEFEHFLRRIDSINSTDENILEGLQLDWPE